LFIIITYIYFYYMPYINNFNYIANNKLYLERF